MASESFPTFTLFGWESFALFGLVSGTMLNFFTTTLAPGWKGLFVKGVAMVHLCLMSSTVSFFNDG